MFGLGSNSQLAIGLAVHLEDRFSGTARNIANSMAALNARRSNLINQAAHDYQMYATRVATAGAVASFGLLEAIKSGAEFEKKIQKVTIVGEGVLGKGQMRKAALQLAEDFRMGPSLVAEALFENVKAGVTENIELITKYQLAVATATGEMLEGQDGVAKGLLNIANSMQINYKNFSAVANATTVAANRSLASVNSLTEGMAYSANDFFQLYGGSSQTQRIDAMSKNLAALAMLSQMGIEGSSAGVALANLVRYATTGSGAFTTKKQTKALAMMGLAPGNLRDSRGNVLDLLSMLDLFASRASKLSSGDQLDALYGLLGVRGKKGAINLMGADGRGITTRMMYQEIVQGIKKDVALNQAKQMMDNLSGDLALVRVKWAKFLIAFTDAVEPLVRRIIPWVSRGIGLLERFSNTTIGGFVAKTVAVAIPLITVLFGLRAAALAATFALGGIGSVGSFSNIMRAQVANLGAASLAARGIAINAAGRRYVMAGRTIDYGGRTYRGGQLLPAAAMGMNTAMGLAGLGSMMGRGVGLAGRVLGFLTGPWGIGISLALTFLPMIYDVLKSDSEENEDMEKGYLPSGFNSYLPGYDKNRVDALNRLGLGDVAKAELQQKIEIFVNGEKSDTINQTASFDQDLETLNQINIDF